jgi:hypothetical protein
VRIDVVTFRAGPNSGIQDDPASTGTDGLASSPTREPDAFESPLTFSAVSTCWHPLISVDLPCLSTAAGSDGSEGRYLQLRGGGSVIFPHRSRIEAVDLTSDRRTRSRWHAPPPPWAWW